MNKKILISGVGKGLGRYLHENFQSQGLTRENYEKNVEELQKKYVETIIHCAFSSNNNPTEEKLKYVRENIDLTQELLNIPHKKFILISSVDVYPKDGKKHTEEEDVFLDKTETVYGLAKLMSEGLATLCSSSPLILRCSGLLGPYMRKNNLKKILEEESPNLSLNGNSEINCVLYEDIKKFIEFSIGEDISGVYNTASSENVSLSEISKIFEKNVQFGKYEYLVGKIDNKKISEMFPLFKKTSKEVIKQYFKK